MISRNWHKSQSAIHPIIEYRKQREAPTFDSCMPIVQYEFMRCYPAASVYIFSINRVTIYAENLLQRLIEPYHIMYCNCTVCAQYSTLYPKWKCSEKYEHIFHKIKLNQWLKRYSSTLNEK